MDEMFAQEAFHPSPSATMKEAFFDANPSATVRDWDAVGRAYHAAAEAFFQEDPNPTTDSWDFWWWKHKNEIVKEWLI